MSLTNLYVLDKVFGEIHRIGENPHDSLSFSKERGVCYYNMQNGCGCSMADDSDNYTFIASEYGFLTDEFGILEDEHRKIVEEYLRRQETYMVSWTDKAGKSSYKIFESKDSALSFASARLGKVASVTVKKTSVFNL